LSACFRALARVLGLASPFGFGFGSSAPREAAVPVEEVEELLVGAELGGAQAAVAIRVALHQRAAEGRRAGEEGLPGFIHESAVLGGPSGAAPSSQAPLEPASSSLLDLDRLSSPITLPRRSSRGLLGERRRSARSRRLSVSILVNKLGLPDLS
jgi:hypothetical protein